MLTCPARPSTYKQGGQLILQTLVNPEWEILVSDFANYASITRTPQHLVSAFIWSPNNFFHTLVWWPPLSPSQTNLRNSLVLSLYRFSHPQLLQTKSHTVVSLGSKMIKLVWSQTQLGQHGFGCLWETRKTRGKIKVAFKTWRCMALLDVSSWFTTTLVKLFHISLVTCFFLHMVPDPHPFITHWHSHFFQRWRKMDDCVYQQPENKRNQI